MQILGIKINELDQSRVLTQIREWLATEGQYQIATINPEFAVAAQKNQAFKNLLNRTALNTCDGFGLVLAARLLYGRRLLRVTGADLSRKLLEGALPMAKIYLLGGAPGIAEAVRTKFVFTGIVGAEDGGKINSDGKRLENNEAIIERINASGANILLVAFGQVKQEQWIAENLAGMPGVKVAIGVGGTLDYLADKIKRAPEWLRAIGFEWLFRLIKEPKRRKRIWQATAVFGWLALKEKIKK
ncbi:MAG: WecB/TagA/CpsF family glycosyltransferase [Patescibacteria group bacterium]|jgi:N-acetylglucosaminyldiphosphoundecaprenol N-acetyl-beta-D-mannosaminyltransferase